MLSGKRLENLIYQGPMEKGPFAPNPKTLNLKNEALLRLSGGDG